MKLRVFTGRSSSAALAEVRAALGEDAVVLATRRVPGGVEVTAALEAAEPLLIPPEPLPATPRPELARHNIPAAVAALLPPGPLESALAQGLRFVPLPEGRPLLLVGPPGAGKTLTAAKLAARAVMAGAAPLVVTTDGARAGAVEQLAAFTRILRLTLAVAAQPEALGKALAGRAHGQSAILDGFGCDPFNTEHAARLLRLIRAADAAPVLVLPAGLDAEESGEIARAFHALGARHLVATRLDAARRLGGVLAAAAAGLAISEGGVSPNVSEGLVPLDAAALAARLLRPATELRA